MIWKILAVLAALPVLVVCLVVFLLALAYLPPFVSFFALLAFGLGIAFVVTRRRAGPVSESSLIGSHRSKGGLL